MTTATSHTSHRQATDRQGLAYGRLHLAVCLFAALMGTAQAEESYQSQDALRQSARHFLETQLSSRAQASAEIALGRLDSRLRLSPCDTPLQPFLPAGAKLQGRLSVGIRCSDTTPWTVYLSADIKVFADVMVAARPLSRGETLASGDTVPLRMEVSKLNSGYYLRDDELAGKILRRAIPAGQALTPRVLREPLLVHRGDDVTIIATTAGLQVRMKGKALEDGTRGARVSVRNTRSKRIVEGTAVKPGEVQVLM